MGGLTRNIHCYLLNFLKCIYVTFIDIIVTNLDNSGIHERLNYSRINLNIILYGNKKRKDFKIEMPTSNLRGGYKKSSILRE